MKSTYEEKMYFLFLLYWRLILRQVNKHYSIKGQVSCRIFKVLKYFIQKCRSSNNASLQSTWLSQRYTHNNCFATIISLTMSFKIRLIRVIFGNSPYAIWKYSSSSVEFLESSSRNFLNSLTISAYSCEVNVIVQSFSGYQFLYSFVFLFCKTWSSAVPELNIMHMSLYLNFYN